MDAKEHGECFTVRGQEGRAQPRFSVDEDSTQLLVAHGMPIKARIADLSLEGCRVRTADRFPMGVRRAVEITFKVNGVAFRFSGVVQWSDGHHMLGIHFVNMIPRRKVELAEVIEEMAAAAAARAQAVNQLVAEQAIPELVPAAIPEAITAAPVAAKANELQPAPKTVDLPAEQPPAESPTPAEIEPSPRPPAKLRDRRGQIRHEVDTLATIFLVKVGSALRGRILDLSLSGCRIRTDERFQVGIYTRVETEFHLEGLPFRLGGVIQAIHNRNMVGIRFLDLSERKRQQVLDLIGELEEMRATLLDAEASSPETQLPADGG